MPVPPANPAADGGNWLKRTLRTLFGRKPASIRAGLQVVLDAGTTHETGFSPKERTMLSNVLGLRERRVDDVMVPRADIVAVQKDITLGDLLKVFASAGHSRLVVYDDTLDDAIGMVHLRDLVAFMTERAATRDASDKSHADLDLKAVDLATTLADAGIVRDMLFAPPSMPVLDLFARMQATRIHLALVIDEYGGADGVVSIEDIVEQVVGDIDDEHDEDEPPSVVQQTDGSFIADGRASLEDATAIMGPEFDVGEAAKDVDTLAGYIASRIGRVPLRGELVPGPGRFEIEVLDADPRRVKKLKIYRASDDDGAGSRELPRRAAALAQAARAMSDGPTTPAEPVAVLADPSATAAIEAPQAKVARRP